jgi:hypothetical protein
MNTTWAHGTPLFKSSRFESGTASVTLSWMIPNLLYRPLQRTGRQCDNFAAVHIPEADRLVVRNDPVDDIIYLIHWKMSPDVHIELFSISRGSPITENNLMQPKIMVLSEWLVR